MHEVVTRLDTDNFIVRPKRRYVEKFSDRENLSKLSPGDVLDLDQNIAPLPYEDDDEENRTATLEGSRKVGNWVF